MPTRILPKPPSCNVQLRRGLKTVIRSNCAQLRRNAIPLKTRAFGVVRQVLSGGVEPPTLTDAPGVRVLIPDDPSRGVRGELNSPAAAVRAKTVKPRGLPPRYFTNGFPTQGTAVSPSTGLRPATVMGTKPRPSPPRPRNGDANGGTQSADAVGCSHVTDFDTPGCGKSSRRDIQQDEHPTVEGHRIPLEASRERVVEPRKNTEPQTPLRGILVARLRLAGNQNATCSGDAL